MANLWAELHDSILAVLWYDVGDEAVLIFRSLYIHQSDGRAGVAPGVGWFQRAELVVENASLTEFIRAWPVLIYDGESIVDGVTYRNGLPVPFRCEESFKIVLEGVDDDNNPRRIEIEGGGATLTLLGRPGKLEKFEGGTRVDDAQL